MKWRFLQSFEVNQQTLTLFILFYHHYNLSRDTNLQDIQSTVQSNAGKDAMSSSPHFEWHLQFFHHEKLKVQTILVPSSTKEAVFLHNYHNIGGQT